MGEQKAQAGASADRRKPPHCRTNPHRPRTRRKGIGGQRGYIVAKIGDAAAHSERNIAIAPAVRFTQWRRYS